MSDELKAQLRAALMEETRQSLPGSQRTPQAKTSNVPRQREEGLDFRRLNDLARRYTP